MYFFLRRNPDSMSFFSLRSHVLWLEKSARFFKCRERATRQRATSWKTWKSRSVKRKFSNTITSIGQEKVCSVLYEKRNVVQNQSRHRGITSEIAFYFIEFLFPLWQKVHFASLVLSYSFFFSFLIISSYLYLLIYLFFNLYIYTFYIYYLVYVCSVACWCDSNWLINKLVMMFVWGLGLESRDLTQMHGGWHIKKQATRGFQSITSHTENICDAGCG